LELGEMTTPQVLDREIHAHAVASHNVVDFFIFIFVALSRGVMLHNGESGDFFEMKVCE
jgi:hypothetical protein